MSICTAEFKDEETQINWVLSYMSLRRAAKFSARVMRHLANTGTPLGASGVPRGPTAIAAAA